MEASDSWEVWGGKEVGVCGCLGRVMVLVFGRISRKSGRSLKAKFSSLLGMEEPSFGWTIGVSPFLKDYFLTLFSISNSKDSSVVGMWEQDEEVGHWSPCFSRHFHD